VICSSFVAAQQSADAGCKDCEHRGAVCREAGSALADDELEIHIEDAHWQYRTAYERFQLHGCPCDRDEALLHLHRMNTAILARSAAIQAARHAAFERRLDEGVDYFQVQGLRDRSVLASSDRECRLA
jgi:hypothetical protein